jgi:hypothetical protein
MTLVTTTKPLLLGRLAVYASDMQVARQVYAMVFSRARTQAFGTVRLDTGDEVDWVDMTYGAIHLGSRNERA